ncbi:hypothetical protein KC721_02620 [Candidatus Woesebacteria bacterium]|nr:hypothetical protein [Candidatus Woesebacteria bacterium]
MKSNTKKLLQLRITIQGKLRSFETYLKKNPLLSLFVILVLLLGVIALNSYLRRPVVEDELVRTPKSVSLFSVGDAPRIVVSASVTQSDVLTVYAQAGGVVRQIHVAPGEQVWAYKTLVSLSSNYYGGNALTIQRRLAELQNEQMQDTYQLQKDSIASQREQAHLREESAEDQREIAEKSINETRDLLELNEILLSGIDVALASATQSAEISALQSQKAQLLSGISQIKQGLRQSEYAANDDSAQAKLSEEQKVATLRQLDIQEKALDMNKEMTELQLKLARVQEATMYPASPFAGVVERVFVQPGDLVNPGAPLVTLKTEQGSTTLVARVSRNIAENVSHIQPTLLQHQGEVLELYPSHVSSVPTDGGLYSIQYVLDAEAAKTVSDGAYVSLSVPLGSEDTNSVLPYVPLEAVYQSEKESTLHILRDGRVMSQKVELGLVQGRFVAVTSPLADGTQIILDRDVIEGQEVVAE